ncbi:iron uptake system protein EfeO [Mangrovibrevibacter kandeliae]|uniref:iron uptake system protein EfeO n=1 Tax=Mangrovibrevibacter kandeliae TaxID=2968473 RepID=UPI00211747ED|nr:MULTISPECIES: iron uptake system protein EfeO [unclassified Aurantimonas]MCQ8783705.1 iron uptake system protein EfeO [Aurantimonas sp. CSK15Z-1]MCW4116332.1 iron uptake system protein EfeO [Aurantimonas sp. MSK8Z-1]
MKQKGSFAMLKHLMAASALTLVLAGPALAAKEVTLDLVEPIADYKIFVAEKTGELVADTQAFVDAIKSGDLDKAKTLYAPTRMHYEAIEPIAELFSDLDASMDARADDYEKREADPDFTGFHRIEYGLWDKGSTEGLEPFADKLLADVTELNKRITDLVFPPDTVVGGAAALMEEVAATKISGEEDRYSHTDLWDFKANSDGSQKIFELVRPLIAETDPAFVEKVESNFNDVDVTLAKYESGDGYELYDKLTDQDRTLLAARVNTLAEDLSTLPGKLGLD